MSRSVSVIVRAAVAAIALFAGYWSCVMPFRCNRTVLAVDARTDAASRMLSVSQARTVAEVDMRMLDESASGCRTSVDVPLLRAANATLLGDRYAAQEYLGQAIAIEPRPEIYMRRAENELALRRVADAERDYTVALRFNRNNLEEIEGEMRVRVLAAVDRIEKP